MSVAHGPQFLGMSADGETVTLRRFHGEFAFPSLREESWCSQNEQELGTGIVLDTETTGLDPQSDSIIEIGLRRFRFHRTTGEVVAIDDGYNGLQDPGKPLPELITRITGLTDADVQGQSIDWQRVGELCQGTDWLIAHNAAFDRPFLDRAFPELRGRFWACSLNQVDWAARDYPSRKLEVLTLYHGFFTEAHRALRDADALLKLIGTADPRSGEPYLAELLRNAERPRVHVFAHGSPFATKDLLRERGYRWDAGRKVWHRHLYKDEWPSEREWMEAEIYDGRFGGEAVDIPLEQNFCAEA